jgi:hypothetical protein
MERILQEGDLLTVYLPPTNRAFVFRVISVVNKSREEIPYGLLPIASGETLATYEGGTTTAPADGVIPGRSYTPSPKKFPLSGAYDETDMWYTPKDYRNRLFHVFHLLTPGFLRAEVQIPTGVTQGRFQKDKIITGVEKDFGFYRGEVEVVHVPEVHYGFKWGNDTNMSLNTSVTFLYGEYLVEIPRDPEFLFNVLIRRIPSRWYTMPIGIYDLTLKRGLMESYGFEGFTVYGMDKREAAIEEYRGRLEVSAL